MISKFVWKFKLGPCAQFFINVYNFKNLLRVSISKSLIHLFLTGIYEGCFRSWVFTEPLLGETVLYIVPAIMAV